MVTLPPQKKKNQRFRLVIGKSGFKSRFGPTQLVILSFKLTEILVEDSIPYNFVLWGKTLEIVYHLIRFLDARQIYFQICCTTFEAHRILSRQISSVHIERLLFHPNKKKVSLAHDNLCNVLSSADQVDADAEVMALAWFIVAKSVIVQPGTVPTERNSSPSRA